MARKYLLLILPFFIFTSCVSIGDMPIVTISEGVNQLNLGDTVIIKDYYIKTKHFHEIKVYHGEHVGPDEYLGTYVK